MRYPLRRRRLLFMALLLLIGGCSSDSDSESDAGGASDGADTGAVAGACSEQAVDIFSVGLSKATSGGTWTVALMSATPSPPDRGYNQFQVVVTDSAGAKVDGLTVTVEPEMPQHGHGTVPATFAATVLGDGAYELPEDPDNTPIDLFMPGAWTIHFHVEDADGKKETASFVFCLEG